MVVTIAIICFLLVMGWNSAKPFVESKLAPTSNSAIFEIPEPVKGTLYKKKAFALSYVEEYELVEWAAYQLTRQKVRAEKFKRDQDFQPDKTITTRSAHYRDYKNSGYRRGHLVPSYDMAYNKEVMDETFLMSNVVPMKEEFNDGVWHDLENKVRDWADQYGSVDIVAGPVFKDGLGTIGENEVFVPRYFYKVVFTDAEKSPRCIGFLFDQTNMSSTDPFAYSVPVDSIEKLTGIDFFSNRFGSWEKEITEESSNSPEVWR